MDNPQVPHFIREDTGGDKKKEMWKEEKELLKNKINKLEQINDENGKKGKIKENQWLEDKKQWKSKKKLQNL